MMAFKYDSINHAQQDAFDVYQRYLLAGEDLSNNVMRIAMAPVASASYSANPFFDDASVDGAMKTSAGALMSAVASNMNAARRYLQVHNKASALALNDVPLLSFPIPAGTALAPGMLMLDSEFFGLAGVYCSLGVRIGVSTTSGAYTAGTAADHDLAGMYL